MKVVKINAVWCSGCLVMNKIWNRILETYHIETIDLDYDMDGEKVLSYEPGTILPVFIFFCGDVEVGRIVGEKSEREMLEFIEKLGDLDEKIS